MRIKVQTIGTGLETCASGVAWVKEEGTGIEENIKQNNYKTLLLNI